MQCSKEYSLLRFARSHWFQSSRHFHTTALRSTKRAAEKLPRLTCTRSTAVYSGRASLAAPHIRLSKLPNRPFGTKSSGHDATIFALSTAPGKAAIAIVRCSGLACLAIYKALCPNRRAPKPRHATLRKIYSPSDPNLVLDPGALLLYFPSPDTVTGEDVLEIHLHGGIATVRAVLSAISSITTASQPIRAAEPGEFTQRAFYNARLEITEVEALGDTLAAETETQRALAARGVGGGAVLKARYEDWREQLLQARGELEALIDFSEDQHFDESPAELAKGVAEKVHVLVSQINASIQNASRGELLRNGIKVALLGAPNAGKSSLLNRIVGREAAIVSSTAGTTRDVVETNVDISGFFCNFGDLAGIRGNRTESADKEADAIDDIELEGIRRAKARALDADVVLVVHAIERQANGDCFLARSPEVLKTVEGLDGERQQIIHVINKVDLLPQDTDKKLHDEVLQQVLLDGIDPEDVCLISCNNKPGSESFDGIQELLSNLTRSFHRLTEAVGIPGMPRSSIPGYEESLGASERQARLLAECRDMLGDFLAEVDVSAADFEGEIDIVLAAESLRGAARCLSKITGRGDGGDIEDVLGVVFEKFCVGK